ncbi:glycosyl transferase family protein [Thiomicrorhabdus sp. Kp2]|uniref:glycosyl transferase family protein n=1 Tax=Thiomicrorhabdus sp. Kp2 TaxID=1123518 RepID=UPI00041338B5|nr:glycosyl transferase family protein [Thiomicrorhabdus sp. Kp2]
MNTIESENKPFQFYIQTIGRGQKRRRSLTQKEARDAMRMILAGLVTDMQLGAFLMLIRVREETPEEAAGFLQAIRETLPKVGCAVDIDWGSYAGKRRQLPWFLLALNLLKIKGHTILLHGMVGNESSRLYTQPVVEALGWPIADSLETASQQIQKHGASYLPLDCFAPQIKTLMNTRDELGLRSPIHSLSRMLNPFNARLSVHGVFHKGYDDIHQKTASLLSDNMTIAFCGDGGEAEARPDKKTEVKALETWSEKSHQGEEITHHQAWSFYLPKTFVNADPTAKCLDIDVLLDVWQGKQQNEYGVQTVLQTVSMALMALDNLTFDEAIVQSKQLWNRRLFSSKGQYAI